MQVTGQANNSSNDIVLSARNVDKFYGSVHVVKGLSLDIKKGEILTLLGPSGCGKTTTLRMTIGLENTDGGEIIYKDKVVDSVSQRIFIPPNKRKMGMVFQSYAIWPQMTVFENVAYPLRVRREKKETIKREVERVLELVGLSHVKDRQAPMLSGGQQQRVAFARSLVFNPDILLLDEPFSNLDAQLREQMRFEVKELQQRIGITVLFVTHDQIEALSISDRIAVMRAGEIEQIGSPMEVYHTPSTPFVRDFLGKTITFNCHVEEKLSSGTRVALDGKREEKLNADHPLSDSCEIGQKAIVTIRPERLTVLPYSDSSYNELKGNEDMNVVRGTLGLLFFIGDCYETTITLQCNHQISMELAHTHNWVKGQDVILTFPRKESRLWRD